MQTIDVDRLNLSPGDRVLDLGCGEGRHMQALIWDKLVHVIGIDLNRGSLEEAQSGLKQLHDQSEPGGTWHLQQGDALNLPYPDNIFDVVICSEVLEHIPNYEKVLDEIDRVLTETGQLAVSVPRFGPEKICWLLSDEYHQVDGGHVRIFQENELKQSIENTKFSLTQRHHEHALHSPFWWLKCLLWENREDSWLIKGYNRILEWNLMENPRWLNCLEDTLNPLIGKSTVLYFSRDQT